MFGLTKQTKAFFSFSKLILAVFVSLFIRRLLLFLTKCNQDAKYRKRNQIFTFNFGGGVTVGRPFGEGSERSGRFWTWGKKGGAGFPVMKAWPTTITAWIQTGYISLCCRMDPAFPIQFL
jgi:uncharacterized SAM-binding protein YcdF (DUF218 family)